MSLKHLFLKLMNEYSEAYETVTKTQNFKHPMGSFIRHDIVNEINSFIKDPLYIIKGSCGAGRYTTVPWIAVFDKRITTSAQRGVYIVYLLNKDTKELYLTLNQGATNASQEDKILEGTKPTFTGITGTAKTKTLDKLQTNATKLRSLINNSENLYSDNIDCGSPAYDAGAIYCKKYTIDSMPDDNGLFTDLQAFIDLYNCYYDYSKKTDSWWPSKDEYDTGLTKEDWKKYILEVEKPNHPSPMRMLIGMMRLGGEATCKTLSETYGGSPFVYVGCTMNLGRRVKAYFDLPPCMDGKQERYFPFPFLGKKDDNDKDLYIYKIRPELQEALKELDLSNISPYYEGETTGKFDSWEIIDDTTAIKNCDKSFFDYNGSGIPTAIRWFFDAENLDKTKQVKLIFNNIEYIANVTDASTDRRRTQIRWSAELGEFFKPFKDTPNSFLEFKKTDINVFEITIHGGEKQMTIKEKIENIKSYIAAKGFNYEDDLIENFYLSLKSKPFVILAGTSGTGKTRLVKLFAEAIGAEMKLVPVRPDWSDSSDLFGHTDLSGRFQPGAIIDFIKKAELDNNTPYFLCLDEMNLARVEYYLSDFLSVIETRDRKVTGHIETDPLVDTDYYKDSDAAAKYGRVIISENLYIIGTVNMDETTFPFSKKVLDRANTIEFSYVNLMAKAGADEVPAPQKLDNSFLKSDYLYFNECANDSLVDNVCFNLEELNQILLKANFHVGYRVRDEISFYMMNNKNADLLDENAAFDHEIMQKILPRIQGSSSAIKDVLSELFIKCAGDYNGFSGISTFEQMESFLSSDKESRYPNSAKKIAFMMRRYDEDGFTSYWL